MYIVYLKQAIQLLKQNRFFSAIYILGTALAITMVMVIAIIYYLRTGDIAPESNRSRMMIVKYGEIRKKVSQGGGSSRLSYPTIKECFYPMQVPEVVSAVVPVGIQNEIVMKPGSKETYSCLVMGTDANFWKIFTFHFLNGSPYTKEEFTSGIHKAVICKSLARRLFNSIDVTGKTFTLNFVEYRIAGVVEDVPSIAKYSYAEIWIPFTNRPNLVKGDEWCEGILASMYVYILAKSADDFDRIRDESEILLQKYNASGINYTLTFNKQPDTISQSIMRTNMNGIPDFMAIYLKYILVIAIFLFIPAINLTGMTSLRMKKQMEELGIRKTFGAGNFTLLVQILYENLFLCILGGIAGLIISYGLVMILKEWLLTEYNWAGRMLSTSVEISPGMLLNFSIFGYTFLFCIVLNLLSALLPAWLALRKPIIATLYDK